MKLELVTPRLKLTSIDESKAIQVLDYVQRNKEFLKEWEILRAPDYYTLEAQKNLIHQDIQQMERGQLVRVWMYKLDELEKIIGSITLSNIVKGGFLSCYLGYRIDEQERNKGYMTEGIKHMIEFAFNILQLHRIEANIMPRNTASIKVVQKLGFHNEGAAKKYLKINGNWEDHVHMVLLNDDME
ncbi:GNAT family N-acetyltransferase [Paenibacillus sp. MER TA 81-3]|uniref:GNAT family N-acetyltransferase n=1 Tax=Paenibacillus sp. MER TA 81-3 TaxID=2939573 RepID=UPI00203F36E9|nr:GNAT family N-acetyltransferase [Paenibacillus sp. MER TA 81-3]MCM3337564.1 GNAT family N-acetyltransferase [Paenibacillus sp. MER TA 81-3]